MPHLDLPKGKFYKFRLRHLRFMGTPAIAIQVIDATKKIRSKIVEKHID